MSKRKLPIPNNLLIELKNDPIFQEHLKNRTASSIKVLSKSEKHDLEILNEKLNQLRDLLASDNDENN
jgi:hypothetical protein